MLSLFLPFCLSVCLLSVTAVRFRDSSWNPHRCESRQPSHYNATPPPLGLRDNQVLAGGGAGGGCCWMGVIRSNLWFFSVQEPNLSEQGRHHLHWAQTSVWQQDWNTHTTHTHNTHGHTHTQHTHNTHVHIYTHTNTLSHAHSNRNTNTGWQTDRQSVRQTDCLHSNNLACLATQVFV